MTADALPPERPGYPAPPELAARRSGFKKAIESGAWATEEPPEETQVAGRRVLRFRPDGAPKGYVLHFHGGGYRLGGPEWEAPFAAALAKRCPPPGRKPIPIATLDELVFRLEAAAFRV